MREFFGGRLAIYLKEKEQWKGMTEEQKSSWLNEQNAQIKAYEKERDEAEAKADETWIGDIQAWK